MRLVRKGHKDMLEKIIVEKNAPESILNNWLRKKVTKAMKRDKSRL